MKNHLHDRARELVTLSSVEGLTQNESAWLQAHLAECGDCARYAEASSMARSSLRALSFKVDPSLVAVTQMRTRLRARELHEREQKLMPIWISCVVALLVAVVTTPCLWQVFAWIGGRVSIAPTLWRAGFIAFWFFPGILGLIVALMIRGAGSKAAAE